MSSSQTESPKCVSYTKSHCTHTCKFDRVITEDEFWNHLTTAGFYGYHPAGYGGYVTQSPLDAAIWVYRHSNSCD